MNLRLRQLDEETVDHQESNPLPVMVLHMVLDLLSLCLTTTRPYQFKICSL